jgi:hypothetical protein
MDAKASSSAVGRQYYGGGTSQPTKSDLINPTLLNAYSTTTT